MTELTHASFFSGVGGVDLGLERSGWRTVSFSEIEPYPSAVLAERWPDTPNLGDITAVVTAERNSSRGHRQEDERRLGGGQWLGRLRDDVHVEQDSEARSGDRVPVAEAGHGEHGDDRDQPTAGVQADAWRSAALWSGGFPCQDLSVAGKRAGFGGERSVLAFAFLELVSIHRPRAILLENVPGLLSSNNGLDFYALIREMEQLGYGVAWRVLDAQFFGVPQRRRRVFILGLRSDTDDPDGRFAAQRAGEVLSVESRCSRHPAKGGKARSSVTGGPRIGLDIAGGLTRRYGKGVNTTADDGGIVIGSDPQGSEQERRDGPRRGPGGTDGDSRLVSPSPDSRGVREAAGDAGRLDDSARVVAFTQNQRAGALDGEQGTHQQTTVMGFALRGRAEGNVPEEFEDITPAVRGADGGSTQSFVVTDTEQAEDDLLPLGLDSHRYRAVGNAVAVPVIEWIGHRLADELQIGWRVL